jgi:hypothetical protein
MDATQSNGSVLCCSQLYCSRKNILVAIHVTNDFILSFHIDFNSSVKEEASAESCVGGGELFEKFQQKQKSNKETTNSMGGKRFVMYEILSIYFL